MIVTKRVEPTFVSVWHMTCATCESEVETIQGDPDVGFFENTISGYLSASWTCPVCGMEQESSNLKKGTDKFPLKIEKRYSTIRDRCEMAMWKK